jgi:hypothetical protein
VSAGEHWYSNWSSNVRSNERAGLYKSCSANVCLRRSRVETRDCHVSKSIGRSNIPSFVARPFFVLSFDIAISLFRFFRLPLRSAAPARRAGG